MDISKIPFQVLNDIRFREIEDSEISTMSPEELFCEYCMWNGLIGWGDILRETLDALRAADEPK